MSYVSDAKNVSNQNQKLLSENSKVVNKKSILGCENIITIEDNICKK